MMMKTMATAKTGRVVILREHAGDLADEAGSLVAFGGHACLRFTTVLDMLVGVLVCVCLCVYMFMCGPRLVLQEK